MMKQKRKWLYRTLIGLGALFLLTVLLVIVFRENLVRSVIERTNRKLEEKYDCHLTVKNIRFEGLSTVNFEKVVLYPTAADTLLSINELKARVNPWKLCVAQLQLDQLFINKGYVQLIKTKDGSNFGCFLKKEGAKKTQSTLEYNELLNRLSTQLLDLIPTDLKVAQFAFKANHNGYQLAMNCTQMQLIQKKLTTQIQVISPEGTQEWVLEGLADPRERQTDLQWKSPKNEIVSIPYFFNRFGLEAAFKSAHLHIDRIEMTDGFWELQGFANLSQSHVFHAKIASNPVELNTFQFDFTTRVGARSVELDSSSVLQMNALKLRPFIRYQNDASKQYALSLNIENTSAQTFIEALPKGLFPHFDGMQAQGSFTYNLQFSFDTAHPKDLVFESHFKPKSLAITQYGTANLNKLNDAFLYRAIERGVLQRPVWIGPENPMYYRLDQVSPYLKNCVLTCEDPSFFHHRGFITEAFKQSIARNIKTKKFARGASTISMQLVKNVFLTREKTLSRKLEEILLVYVLENQRIASKERLFEIYLNLIEWGPNVYGIGEAAAFYFSKTPDQLSYAECLFLATIIPRPKGFMTRFAHEGALKAFAKKQQDFLTKLQFRRGLLTETDTVGYHQPLQILGAARSFLKADPALIIQDTIEPADAF
ncbi:MAG: glycosyl transferase [Flavobacterium sp. BFFFF2]|nr:MAG: glycosyl transferase [Flavobacterium sp. BFFFF2]